MTIKTDPKRLIGMTVSEARYMTEAEQEDFGFYAPTLVLGFTGKGNDLIGLVQCDPEGNGPGCLYLTEEEGTEELYLGG